MRGSLDQPPIILGGAWSKVAMLLLGSIVTLVFTLLSVGTFITGVRLYSAEIQVWFAVPWIALFVAITAYFLIHLFVPLCVEMDTSGITIRVALRRTHYPWAEIVSIEAVELGTRAGPMPFAVLDVRSAGGATQRVLFPRRMELRIGDLVALADAARERWGDADRAPPAQCGARS